MLAMAFSPLPVEEKAIPELPGIARDGLSPLPVEEKAISRLPGRPWESSVGMLAMPFSPCLSRKRLFQGLPE